MTKKTSQTSKARILLYDIETSGIVATTWNLYPESISHHNMIMDWFIISVAWKWLGESKVHTVSVMDDKKRFKKDHTDDFHVIKTFREVLQSADVVVAHNGDKFDIKMFNSRIIFHSLPPLRPVLSVDTLKEVKKVARFTSNRLDFLGKIFTGEGKKETPPGTWKLAMQGQPKAIRDMVSYNKVDVLVLEKVYKKLLPYMKSHPHVGVIIGKERESCPACGGTHVKNNGIRTTAAGVKRQERQCQDCGKYSSGPLKTK